MELNLTGRSALITGGSKGIGRAAAQVLAEEGVHLHLAARNLEALQAARDEITAAHGVTAEIHASDLSLSGDVEKLLNACNDVDILVNNAGTIPAGTISRVDEASWRNAWDLKVFGYINMCRGMLARMAARRSGTIINVIGNAGERHDAKYIAGSVGNAALIALTKTLGGASVDDNVRIVGINPGRIATERLERQLRRRADIDHQDPDRWEEYLAELPFGRLRPSRRSRLANRVPGIRSGGLYQRYRRDRRRRRSNALLMHIAQGEYMSDAVTSGYIPVIDLSASFSDGDGRATVAKEIAAACESLGFLIVTGHGVAATTISGMVDTAMAFFTQPLEARIAAMPPHPYVFRGYFPV